MNDKLSDLLSACRKDYSTQHVLLHAIEEWKVGVVLMDPGKAFDAIHHGLLLTKLYTYCISKDACKMVRSYWINWMQRDNLDDLRSNWKSTVCGVPQGSQSGSRIFNIFLNDIFYFLEGLCQTTNYADDNSLASIDHDINVIQKDLEFISEVAMQWFKDNFMKANVSKFSALCVSRYINPPIL